MTAEKLFLICKGEKPAGFSPLLFHERGCNGRRHLLVLAPCGSIAPARKRTLSGASPPLPCGELPPQRLRGLQIGEAKKMRLAKRLAFFRFDFSFGIIKGEQPLVCNGDDRRQRRIQGGAVGAAACRMRVPPKARSRRRVPQPVGSSASKSLRPCRAKHAAFASQTGLRLKSPTGAFMPCGHRRPFWFSFMRQKRTLSLAKHFRKRPLGLPAAQISPRPSVIIDKPVIVFFAFE